MNIYTPVSRLSGNWTNIAEVTIVYLTGTTNADTIITATGAVVGDKVHVQDRLGTGMPACVITKASVVVADQIKMTFVNSENNSFVKAIGEIDIDWWIDRP